jgi:hypothetical protein
MSISPVVSSPVISTATIPVPILSEEGEVLEVLYLKRVPRNKMSDLIVLQQALLESFVESNGSVGECVAQDKTWKNIVKMGKLIPVVGSSEPFDVSVIENDLDQIQSLFFSATLEEEIINAEGYSPGLIAKLHKINYAGSLGKAYRTVKERLEEKAEMV